LCLKVGWDLTKEGNKCKIVSGEVHCILSFQKHHSDCIAEHGEDLRKEINREAVVVTR
jgi:hypothetical protein